LHKIIKMAKFIILYSPNKSNIGTVAEHSETYYNPNKKKVTDEELAAFKLMSDTQKRVWIEESLISNDNVPSEEKKSVEGAQKVVEHESVNEIIEVPNVEESKEFETIELPIEEESIAEVTEAKKKGRPTKK